VETKFTGPAIKEFLAEFGRLKGADISPEEATKTAAIRRADFISGLGTLEGLIGTAVDLNNQGKPFSSLEATLEELSGFSAESLNKVAPMSLLLERGLLVLVGDKEKIVPQLEGLDLPAPEEVK
jgi:predicted Zn-dependent peptidase